MAPVPAGYTSLTPYFGCADTNRAIRFSVFGARVVTRSDGPEGTVAHRQLDLDNGRMQVSDLARDHHLVAPDGGDAVSRSTVLYCTDVDAVYAGFVDAFGHRWAVMTRVEDGDPEEAQRRVDALLASGS